jgi:predicted ATPase
VHWSDPTTLESLDLLIDRVLTLRVLVIITFRPEFTPPWIGRSHVTLLTLNRLPPRQRAEMIGYMTGGKGLPREISDQIVVRTDGIPLFIEDLTKTVVESGILTEVGDHYALTGPMAPLAIPTSLHASLLARLDRLAPTREVAQIGAALGRSFSYELISGVAGMPQQKLDEALDQLASAELIFRRGVPPDAEYTFKHALVQDAAYSTLLRSGRQQLHAHITAILEDKFPEIVGAEPQLLAQHCTEAGLNEKAIDYWLKAGRQAVARSAMPEAVAQLRKGLTVLANQPDSPSHQEQELNFQSTLGRALLSTKGYSAPEVGETYTRARVLAEQLGQPGYQLLYGQWVFHLVRAEHELSLSSAEQIVRNGQARNDPAARLLGLQASGTSYFFLGNFFAARTVFEQCGDLCNQVHRSIYTALTPIDPYLVMLGYYGLTLGYLGDLGGGRDRVNEALALARRQNHAYALASVLIYACWMEWIASSPAEAERLASELITLSDANGFSDRLGWALFHRGWSLTALGEAQEGSALIVKGLSSYRATGAVSGTPWMLMMLAGAHWKLGNPTAGLVCLAEVETIIEKTNERREGAELHRLRGELVNDLGDKSAAERHYEKALSVARQQGAKIFELRTATSLARLWRDRGETSQASSLLIPIVGSFQGGNDASDLKTARVFLNKLKLPENKTFKTGREG